MRFARVIHANFERASIPEALAAYRDEVVPTARKQKGYAGGLLLLDRETSHAVSMGFWRDHEALVAGDASPYYVEQVSKMGKFFVSMPERKDYEVAVYAQGETQPPADAHLFARVVRTTFHVNRADEGIKVYSEGLIASARKQDGFVAALLLMNRDDGDAISLSLWNGEDAVSRGEISAYYISQVFKMVPFVASLPDREQYEAPVYIPMKE